MDWVRKGWIMIVAVMIGIGIGIHQRTNTNLCCFPAIYSFGDSNSDTGSISAAYTPFAAPNGNTFFSRPSGRLSDGRLIIDFIAQSLGLPFLNAYLDSIGTSFRHGANFAASGSTVQPSHAQMLQRGKGGHPNPFPLDIQLLQFQQFKSRTTYLYEQGKKSVDKSGLPRPQDFSKALYTIDSGQNDLDVGIKSMKEEEVLAYIPDIIDNYASAIETLHQLGARFIWVYNTGPIGCLPYYIIKYAPEANNTDLNGCVVSFNNLAKEFNNQLQSRVSQLRTQLQDAFITYVDIYSAKYALFSEPEKNGFKDPLKFCCGDTPMGCGHVNRSESCTNPEEYVTWDSVHYTEAANNWIANHILHGSFSDPPISIPELHHQHTSTLFLFSQ